MVKVESAVPLYKQIVHDLVSRIESGVYSEGDKLPTETELMEEYGVSRITVRSAIKELEDADIVERTRGKGTFVTTTRNAYAADDQESFTHSCIQENKKPSTVVLEVAWIYPTLRDVRFLQVQEGENILQTRRLRLVDGVPTMLETNSYTPSLAFLEHEDLSGSLLEVLGRRHIELGNNERTLQVCFASAYEAEHLNVKPGSALLLFVDKRCNAQGVPLFISRQVYCTERLKFYL